MTTVTERPGVQCRYRNQAGEPCPLNADPDSEFCRFHRPIRRERDN